MKDFPFCLYDADTVQGTPNFIPGKYAINLGKGKDEYMGYIFDEFIKYPPSLSDILSTIHPHHILRPRCA